MKGRPGGANKASERKCYRKIQAKQEQASSENSLPKYSYKLPKRNKNANEKKSKKHGGGIKMGVNNVG